MNVMGHAPLPVPQSADWVVSGNGVARQCLQPRKLDLKGIEGRARACMKTRYGLGRGTQWEVWLWLYSMKGAAAAKKQQQTHTGAEAPTYLETRDQWLGKGKLGRHPRHCGTALATSRGRPCLTEQAIRPLRCHTQQHNTIGHQLLPWKIILLTGRKASPCPRHHRQNAVRNKRFLATHGLHTCGSARAECQNRFGQENVLRRTQEGWEWDTLLGPWDRRVWGPRLQAAGRAGSR